MNTWEEYSKIFNKSSLEEIYDNHIALSGATGIDKINHDAFFSDKENQIEIIAKKAIAGSYKLTNYKLKLISKGRGKIPREISIPTIRDRVFLRGLCDFLNIVFKDDLNFDLPQNVIKSVKESLLSGKYTGYIKLDVENFYPSIRHDVLLSVLETRIDRNEILNVFKSSIKTPAVEKAGEEVTSNSQGVPQGLSISNVLAAIYLSGIDKKLISEDFAYYRYVDDILILCEHDKAKDVSQEVMTEFGKLGLKVHEPTVGGEKSTIGKISVGDFTYLGYKYFPGKVTVRDASIEKLKDSLTAIFTAHKYSKKKNEGFLLWRLNLRIAGCIFEKKRKGWLFFFAEITDIDLLHRLDHYLSVLCKRFEVNVKPKSFVRSYYQLNHNIYETKYIPNFDKYSIDYMKTMLEEYFGFDKINLSKMAHSQVRYNFLKKISKQVKDLETDLQDFS